MSYMLVRLEKIIFFNSLILNFFNASLLTQVTIQKLKKGEQNHHPLLFFNQKS